MAPNPCIPFLLLLLLLPLCDAASPAKETFIVIVDPESKPYPFDSHINWYSSLVTSSSTIHLLYESLVHGFSATLTLTLAHQIKSSPGVITVHHDYALRPHTTRSPSFLNLDPPFSLLSNLSHLGSDSIIGVIDTGIWPESPSFSDHDVNDPVPKKWIGECEIGDRFNESNCNRKLIGARYFTAGYAAAFGLENADEIEFLSARDSDGHGTHVASIAAGSPVSGANFEGFAGGTARGMAPKARIAVYKVCWALGCLVSDVISAIERAVSDGVDVISLSLGTSSPSQFYYLDPLAIATFRAALKGVFIATSAGNGGPDLASVANAPPWVTTVGAATIDRDFPASVSLGNGKHLRGRSISLFPRKLQIGKLTGAVHTNLSSVTVRDRIVFLEADRDVSRTEIGTDLRDLGATAMIISHGDLDPAALVAEPHVIPTVAVGSSEAKAISNYLTTASDPTAEILSEGTNLLPHGIPCIIASFSSRGPNPVVPWILKPDLVGPGVNILGSWTAAMSPSGLNSDNRRSGFNIMSGTSMACPHVSGVAALIRSARPEWGPSEIRSALMTTAVTSPILDESGSGEPDPFGLGSGYINPNKALDPGLVYDLEFEDYAGFLCGLGYGEEKVKAVSGRGGVSCERFGGKKGIWGFNYPGIVVEVEELAGKGEVELKRRLKSVDGGGRGSWYIAEVEGLEGYRVDVKPKRLWFGGRIGERLNFRLVLRIENYKENRSWGALTWREERGRYSVVSPIVVFSRELLN